MAARLVCYQIKDFGKIHAGAIDFDKQGKLVTVGGKNAAGKSTVLDGLLTVLGGLPGHIKQPIKRGADEAELKVKINTDGLEVEAVRSFTKVGDDYSTSITVTQNGNRLASPAKLLKKLIGEIGLDPVAFADAQPKSQRATLFSLLGIDTDGIEEEKRKALDDVKIYERQLEQIAGAVDKIVVPADTPDEPVDIDKLLDEATAAGNVAREVEATKERKQALSQKLQDAERLIQECQDEIKACETKLSVWGDTDYAAAEAKLLEQVRDASAVNRAVEQKKYLDQRRSEYRDTQSKVNNAKLAVKTLEAKKAEMLSSASMPVEGLGFDEDGVTLNGVPWGQASRAEQLKAATQIMLSQAGELRVLVVHDGSSLDLESLADLRKIAEETDSQIIVERVCSPVDDGFDSEADFYIVDGEFVK